MNYHIATMIEPQTPRDHRGRGGWRTFPFITGAMVGTGIATGGTSSNLTVYLINKFNIGSIDAAQISSMVNGCINIAPIMMAVVADYCIGCFAVISASTSCSFLGMLLLSLTATLDVLRPPPCELMTSCQGPTGAQLAVLYVGIALWVLGVGGNRLNPATMGANQFDDPADQATFFNWYLSALNAAAAVGIVGVVYVQDNVGWGWGFGLCAAIVAASLLLFLSGQRFYRRPETETKSVSSLLDGLGSLMRWRKATKSDEQVKLLEDESSNSLEHSVEEMDKHGELQILLKLVPLFLSSIPVGVSMSLQTSLTVLQALAMDRHIGASFQIPAGSMLLFNLTVTALFICIFDRFAFPLWRRLARQAPTPLQRVGLGYIICAAAMACSAQVESKRLTALPAGLMSVLWLVPPLLLMGVGEALHYPGSMTLYYQEFPASMRSMATGMVSVSNGVGYYLSAALIGVFSKYTNWLNDDMNASRLDLVYSMVALVGMLNLVCFLISAYFYRKGRAADVADIKSLGDTP